MVAERGGGGEYLLPKEANGSGVCEKNHETDMMGCGAWRKKYIRPWKAMRGCGERL